MSFSLKDIKIPLGELYDSVITDHNSRPRNFVRTPNPEPIGFTALPGATVTMSGDNPTCGDRISLSLSIDPEDRIVGVGFTGEGCMICMASTSMMTTKIKGKTRSEASSLLSAFQNMVSGQAPANEDATKKLGDLQVLSGVGKFPQRIKCATLSWHALKGALAEEGTNNFRLDNNDGGKF